VEKQDYVVTITNTSTGRGRAFEIRTGSVDSLVKAFRTVSEQMAASDKSPVGEEA